jgi:nucleotide-binding universal stress UspA family protein
MSRSIKAKQAAEESVDPRKLERAASLPTMMVYVDREHDSEPRLQLALGLAERFGSTLIGIAGLVQRPALVAGNIAVYTEPTRRDVNDVSAWFEEMAKAFSARCQSLKQFEWRSAPEYPSDLVVRNARAADLIILGPRRAGGRRHDLLDPGAIVLRAGRPVLIVPNSIAALPLRRAVIAWKDTRECRRAVRDALPLLHEAKEVLLFEAGEGESKAQAKQALAELTRYLVRHRVIVAGEIWRQARKNAGSEILELARDENADLIVAGGYGHSRLGEWIFGGVTHELLASSPVCCLLSH